MPLSPDTVAFATRGAMASNRTIVEVLHFVGAKDSYIARQFQSHFLTLGLKGGALGGGAALVFLALAGPVNDLFVGTAGQAEAVATWLTRAMVEGMAALLDPVPVAVEVQIAPTWAGE